MASFSFDASTAGKILKSYGEASPPRRSRRKSWVCSPRLARKKIAELSGAHCALCSPRLSAGGENVSWRAFSPLVEVGHDPEMAGRSIGGGVSHGKENLFAVGREQRGRNGLEVAQIFVGGEMRGRGCRACLCVGAEAEVRKNGEGNGEDQRAGSEHGARIQRRSGVGGVSSGAN